MKIVYLHHSLIISGGVERMIVSKANYLAEVMECEVSIITTDQTGLPLIYPISKQVQHFDLGINFNARYHYKRGLRDLERIRLRHLYLMKLKTLLNKLKPDITICSTYDFMNLKPSVHDGSIKIVESHVAKEYTIDDPHHPWVLKALSWLLYHQIEHFVKGRNTLVTLTNKDAKNWVKILNKAVIPNFLPFYPEQLSTCQNKQVIAVGRLEKQKGFDLLVKAWSIVSPKHPDWILQLYGKGDMKPLLESSIEALDLQNTFFLMEPVSDIIQKYTDSSICVMSSLYEGFGMALIEAMACSIPVVSFDCPNGPADIVRNEEDGFLVEPGNVALLAEKLNFLIENKTERIAMGIRARENVKRFLPGPVMQKWMDLFISLTNSSSVKN
jgi:glycosyltransferase involved in cell wall biosynthesis